MKDQAQFWDAIAPKYATDAIRNMEAYTYTLERTRSYLKPTDKVVELGCGTGSTALLLASDTRDYLGTDISSGMIKIARDKAIDANLAGLSFEIQTIEAALDQRSTFDAVMAFNLLHLVEDIPAAFEAAHACLKPGGLMITKTPCLKSASLKFKLMFLAIPIAQALGKAPFVQMFTVAQYDQMVVDAGFEIIESGNHPDNPPNRYIVARKL